MKMELRVNPTNIEANEDGSMTVSGYVNRTEQYSNLLGRTQRFKEKISKGAWEKAINDSKEIHFLAEHDNNKILASTRNGSLQLTEDEHGLYMTATISPTSWGKDYYTLIKDGILNNMSFGFRAVKDAWRNMGDHFERIVNELELFEVSVVRDPAYSSSSISARGIDLVEDEVPSDVINLRTIEIRSDADIEAIAKKLFEMIQANVKIAEQHEEPEAIDGTEPPAEEAKSEEQTVVEPEPIVEPEKVEPVVEPVKEETVVEEKVEETHENTQPSAAEKIREFINKYKQEEN